jgi:hypothetical protein
MKALDQPRQVYDFLKKHVKADYCDDCLAAQTNVDRHHINTIASTLSLFPKEFGRRLAVCPQPMCQSTGRTKLVTRAN